MKCPEREFVREAEVTTLQGAIDFANDVIKEFGDVAKDYSSYRLFSDSYEEACIQFRLDNPDYDKEIVIYDDWYKRTRLEQVRDNMQNQINAQKKNNITLQTMLDSKCIDDKKLAELKRKIISTNNAIQQLKETEQKLLGIEVDPEQPNDEVKEILQLVNKFI